MNFDFQVFTAMDHHRELIKEADEQRLARAAVRVENPGKALLISLLPRIGRTLIMLGSRLEQVGRQPECAGCDPQSI